jgi:hypothetical protein
MICCGEVFVEVCGRFAVDVLKRKGVGVGGVGNDQGFIVLVLDRRKLGKCSRHRARIRKCSSRIVVRWGWGL